MRPSCHLGFENKPLPTCPPRTNPIPALQMLAATGGNPGAPVSFPLYPVPRWVAFPGLGQGKVLLEKNQSTERILSGHSPSPLPWGL